MQLIIELEGKVERREYLKEDERMQYYYLDLMKVLIRLEEDGYYISSLIGNFIYDTNENKIINCGKCGDCLKVNNDLIKYLINAQIKMVIVFIEEKLVIFDNKFFSAIHFTNLRRVMPLTPYLVFKNYDKLIYDNDDVLLNKLYQYQFEYCYGKDAKPIKRLFKLDELKDRKKIN